MRMALRGLLSLPLIATISILTGRLPGPEGELTDTVADANRALEEKLESYIGWEQIQALLLVAGLYEEENPRNESIGATKPKIPIEYNP